MQADQSGKKKVVSVPVPAPRQRASTLGVIKELPNQDQIESIPQRNSQLCSSRQRIPSSNSISDNGSLPVIAGTFQKLFQSNSILDSTYL